MASLRVLVFAFLMLPAFSFECEKDYDSPKLWLNINPKFLSIRNTGNVSVTCRVAPYRDGLLVAYSWLKVKRNRTNIRTVRKYPVAEGPYNLTLSISKDDFGNETALLVTCQGVMLSLGCTNISKVIKLLDGLPNDRRRKKDAGTVTIYQAIGLTIGLVAVVIGFLSMKICHMYVKANNPPDVTRDPLTECEFVPDSDN